MLNAVFASIAEIMLAALLLYGVLKREKLIAFESAVSDYLARRMAHAICRRRAARARKARAMRAARVRQSDRAALRVVRGQGAAPGGRSIA